jgi:ribonucleoside-diphosphate reductase alpha chain
LANSLTQKAELPDLFADYFVNETQKEIWEKNYRYKDESIEGTISRLIRTIYASEDPGIAQEAYVAMANKRLFFGGRVMANVGTDLKHVFPFNCYAAQRSVKPVDSIKCIYQDLENAAHILKTEGGIGFNFNHLRPRGTYIKGVGVGTPGAISFMDLYNESADGITKGNDGEIFQTHEDSVLKKKIRKGAQMAMLDCRHPDILEFITAKSVPGRLDRFNMSVIITDAFMTALENNEDHELWFPDVHAENYDVDWNGDFDDWEAAGNPKIVYKTMKAQELWDLIITNTYNRNEPGVYFIDNANRYNNLIYYQKVTGTNPCGEIAMLADGGVYTDPKTGIVYEHLGDICNLGSLNLTGYYKPKYQSGSGFDDRWRKFPFDWDTFTDDVELLVRGLDNLIDISGYPLPELKNAAALRRKIGCGMMGYGSLLMMYGIRYGSKLAMEFTEELMRVYANAAYQASARIAAEKGSFILYDPARIFNGGFIKHSEVLSPDTIELIKRNGLRNSQLLMAAPTGTTAMLAGCQSGGIEPVFDREYSRWMICGEDKKKLLKDMDYPDWEKGEWKQTKDFKYDMVGDTQVLISKCGTLMIDQSRGLTRRITVEDYGWAKLKELHSSEYIESLKADGKLACAQNLTATEHIEPFMLLSKYIDNSISKTVNLPHDYPIADFDALYQRLWKDGARGLTTYREGTMMAVLETKKETRDEKKDVAKEQKEFFDIWKEHERGDVVYDDVALPSEYPMQGFKIESEGKKWYLGLSFKDKKCTRPFAIFITTNNVEQSIIATGAIEQLYELADLEGIPAHIVDENDKKCAGQTNVNKIARTMSLLLRHNVKIEKIVKALDNIDIPIYSLVYRIKKFLMRYIDEMDNGLECPHCGDKIRLTEGCLICPGCGFSKC